MSLSSAIGTAYSGLRATQAAMDVVSQNVSNSGTVGYTRRVLSATEQLSGTQTTGVNVVGATRVLDGLVQKQLRLENAGAAYTATRAGYATSLDGIFDPAGGANSLATLLSGLTSSLQALATSPSSYAARAATVSAASNVASQLNDVSDGVTALRQNAETALGQSVSAADGLLQQIASISRAMRSSPEAAASAGLQDGRDGLIDQLSQYMDLKVATDPSGTLRISTTGGLQLFDGVNATRLSFDARPTLSPSSAYSTDPAKRSVGTITATNPSGGTTDVLATGAIRSGSIAALVEIRDDVLPQAQRQADEIAAGLSSLLSDRGVAGTVAASGAATGYDLDLSGLRDGNSFSVTYTEDGTAKTATFVKSASASAAAAATGAGTGVTGIDFSGGMASVVSQMAAKLGSGFAVSSPSASTLRILDDGASGHTDVTGFSGKATTSTTLSGGPELPLFTDGGALFTGYGAAGSQLTGFAGRIGVNPAVLADNGTLVASSSATASSDSTRPSFILSQLRDASLTVSGEAGIGGSGSLFRGTLGDLTNQVIATQAANANAAKSQDDSQQVVLNAIQSRYSETAGVNIDTEMTQLIQLQTAYGANARVMSAAKQMMDALMSVGA